MALLYLLTLISCSLFVVYGSLIIWYFRVWNAIPHYTPHASPRTRLTVIIPARNEEANILTCLTSLAAQTYPKDLCNIIVVDDYSTDRTAALVEEFSAFHTLSIKCIRLADIPAPGNRTAHKKRAIETGIGFADGDLIIATDADCTAHPGWLASIAALHEEKDAKFIAAPVRISGGHQTFLSIFQTLDFITLQGITGAAVFAKVHSMCNGANLAYEKTAFYTVNGFKGIDSIPSGDDMLLMHKIYLEYPKQVYFLKNRHAIVDTKPASNWSEFLHQRIRWASKADTYDDKRIFWVLLLVYLLNLVLAVLLVAGIWNRWYLLVFLLLLVAKTLIEYPFVRSVATFFGQQHLMVYFAALQPFHILYTITVGWLGKFGSYRWKDRKISK